MLGRLIKIFAVALITLTEAFTSMAQNDPKDIDIQGDEPYFACMGEGYTAASASGGIDAAFRMFSTPTIQGICEKSNRPEKLVAPKDVVLHVFESFPFDRLKVLAVDAAGSPLPPVPIAVSEDDRHCLIHTSAIKAQAGNWVVPIRPGRFHFLINTACGNMPVLSAEIEAEVREGRQESYKGPIAEGYTSSSLMQKGIGGLPVTIVRGIDASFGMFTASSLPEICERSARPAKLVAARPNEPVVLSVGTGFTFSGLEVLAVDESGRSLPPVPIKIEVDDSCCLITTIDVLARAGNWVIPIKAGRFHFRVTTICANTPQASVEIEAEVTDEMNIGLSSSTEHTN